MKEVPFSTVEIEQPQPSLERDFPSRHLGAQATHEVVEDPTDNPEINQNYSDPEFPMLSRVIIGGEEYMVTGTWFSVDDDHNYTTDMLAVQRMTSDGETINLTPAELREEINSVEVATQTTFEVNQTADTTLINMLYDNEKYLSVEIEGSYDQQELNQLITANKSALEAIDKFLNGQTYKLFVGLKVKVGEDLTSGGGEAISSKNLILMNGRKTLISLAAMRNITGSYDDSELQGGTIDDNDPSGAFEYNLAHEFGHILDERTKSGNRKHRVSASESPTRYGREPDQYHSEKDHEAFAEGFAHMVYKMPVSDKLAKAVHETIQDKLAE